MHHINKTISHSLFLAILILLYTGCTTSHNEKKNLTNTEKITINCNFNIKDYIEKPWGFKREGLPQALLWVHHQIKGGLRHKKGKKLATLIEQKYWRNSNNPKIKNKSIFRIGSDKTKNGKSYLGIFDAPKQFTFIEIPEDYLIRFDINRNSMSSDEQLYCPINVNKTHTSQERES